MSENFTRLIPVDPAFVPDEDAQERIFAIIASVTPHYQKTVTAKITDEVEFIDQGQLFDHIVCLACGANDAESEQLKGWWPEAMDRAYENHFRDLLVTMPCCGAALSLNDLQYEMPAGFARFVLQFTASWYHAIGEILPDLEQAAGCQFRRISVRY